MPDYDLSSRFQYVPHLQRGEPRPLLESVDDAIARASTAEYVTPETALVWLLRCAWHDLQEARRNAHNGRWSVACEYQVNRIVGLTSLVGPLPWPAVPLDLILDGVYERIHEAIGTPTPLSDADRQYAQQVMDQRL